MHIKIEHDESEPFVVFKDVKSCLEYILSLEKSIDKPAGIFIYNNDGESMSTVIGARTTAFVYYPAGYDGIGSYSSNGDLSSGVELSYWLCGHHTEALAESQVERSKLEPVIIDFLNNGGKSNKIKWVND